MPVPFRFTIPEDEPYGALGLDHCQHRLQDASLTLASRISLMRHQGRLLIESGNQIQALDVLAEAIALQPDDPFSHAYKGWAFEQLGQHKNAKAMYRSALGLFNNSLLSDLENPQASLITAQLWYRCGVVLRTQGRHKQALKHYDRAIDLQPNYVEAISGRSMVLALMGQHKRAYQERDRAISLAPTSPLILNNSGIVWMGARQYGLALAQFQEVLRQDPDFDRAWYNRGLALMRLGRSEEALESFERSLKHHQPIADPIDSTSASSSYLSDSPTGFQSNFKTRLPHHRQPIQPWLISAWTLHAFLSLKKRHLSTTMQSSRQVQRLDPKNYSAALYKFTATIGSGQLWPHLTSAEGRNELGHDVCMIANGLKYRLLGLFAIMALLLWGEGRGMDVVRQYVPLILSLGIMALVGLDLWRHKSRLRFVWKTYFGGGIVGNLLTYIRAILILIVTLTTFTITDHHAPTFMKWGWANAVFGSPGNIIFQPLNLIQDLSFHPLPHQASELQTGLHVLLANVSLSVWDTMIHIPAWLHSSTHSLLLNRGFPWEGMSGLLRPGFLGTPLFHIGHIHVTAASLLIILFWLVLIVGVPFWAHLEEKIFRQGANNWSIIMIRSIQFGLVHLLAGIPILGGFVLIIPGFLFACRYKYVRDRHYHRYQDPQQADQAGVLASTADHAVYNSILMTLAVSTILLEQTIS